MAEGLGTALKPALEPWVLARKPLSGTVAQTVQAHRTGGLNIDACRVGADDGYATNRVTQGGDHFSIGSDEKTRGTTFEPNAAGRWPANVIHDGSDAVLAGFPEAKGAVSNGRKGVAGLYEDGVGSAAQAPGYADTGSAARFFYCAKASKRDRDEGMGDAPDAVLARSNLAATRHAAGDVVDSEGGGFNAARVVKNNHPTVKPTELMRYLCRLITPHGGVVLDPFMGSGSTGKAAVLEGFGFIGIERDPAYYEIALRRVSAAIAARTTRP